MKNKHRYIWTNMKLVFTIVPIVLLMISIYFVLVRREILVLSKEKLALESDYYAEKINTWTDSVLNEVTIYKTMIEQLGLDEEATFESLTTSVNTHEAYPNGLYLGDDHGHYYFASGWDPGEDYIVTERYWYIEGLAHDQFAFGEPYLDAITGKTCVSATSRLNTPSAVTVLSADVYLDYASQLTSEVTSGELTHAFFVTQNSRLIIADNDTAMIGMTLTAEHDSLLYQNVSHLLDVGQTGSYEILGDDSVYFVNIHIIQNTDWYFVTCMNRNEVLQGLWRIEFPMLLIAVVACALLFLLTSIYSREMNTIRTKSKLDPLTKLPNRETFQEYVQSYLKERPGQGILIIIDMDNFKLINDQLGHPVGDQVLCEFATVLEKFFNRNMDIVSRLGGDEFAVFVGRDISPTEADGMLRRFMTVFHQNFDDKYPDQKLGASIGASGVALSDTYELLYNNADKALYEAKWNGKDQFRIRN